MAEWITKPSNIHSGWRCELKIKQYIDQTEEAEEPDNIKMTATRLYLELEVFRINAFEGKWNPDINDNYESREIEMISDQFHTIGFVDEVPSLKEFNNLLDSLYDWADYERVWIT